MHALTWAEVWRRRLARHNLMQPSNSIPEVVRATCGIHAQVQSSAEVSIGLRTQGTTQQDVRKALWEDRTLVRTYGLRGTVHLFAAADVATWLAAFRAKAPPGPRNKDQEAALPTARVAEVVEAIRDALDGTSLDRAALANALEKRLGSWITDRSYPGFNTYLPPWYLALAPAAAAGVLAFGPGRGATVTYVRLDQWLGPSPEIDGQFALRVAVKRFLHTYGPATPVEFARWFLTSGTFARSLFNELQDELEEVDVEGWHAWQLRADNAAQGETGQFGSMSSIRRMTCLSTSMRGSPRRRIASLLRISSSLANSKRHAAQLAVCVAMLRTSSSVAKRDECASSRRVKCTTDMIARRV